MRGGGSEKSEGGSEGSGATVSAVQSSSSWTGRQKARTSVVRRPSTAVRLRPLVGRSGTTSSLLLFFLNLFDN